LNINKNENSWLPEITGILFFTGICPDAPGKEQSQNKNILVFPPSFYFGFLPNLFLLLSIEGLYYPQPAKAGTNSLCIKRAEALFSTSKL
jgi:hypothetical protein